MSKFYCPLCDKERECVTLDTRPNARGCRRRRLCKHCGNEFITIETSEDVNGWDANAYQFEAMRTAKDIPPSQLLQNGVMGLCGESGECIDLVKKHLFQGHELNDVHLMRELGDVAWYLAITAEALGYSLSEIFDENVKKLKKRYPEGFSEEKSQHRTEGDF